jgi:membrane-associated protein
MFDTMHLIRSGGLALIAGIVFFESGMLVGFFLPGDTLLISAGIFAAQGKLPIIWTIVIIAIAGIMGDNLGYLIGRKTGPKVLTRKDGLIFRKSYMEKSIAFYKRHGRKSMLLAHFVPYVRTFAPIVAGVGMMERKRYVIYDAIGVCTWATAVTLIGYFVGAKIPNIDHYILLSFIAVVVVAFGPALYHVARSVYKKDKRKLQRLEEAKFFDLDQE